MRQEKILGVVFCLLVIGIPSLAQTYQYDQEGRLISDASEEIARIQWNNQSKIVKLTRIEGSTKPDLEFAYDAAGNRRLKIVKPRNAAGIEPQYKWQYTYYHYDRMNTPVATYQRNFESAGANNYNDKLSLEQCRVYAGGEDRIEQEQVVATFSAELGSTGEWENKVIQSLIVPAYINAGHASSRGRKRYELHNHQSSVVSTISDRMNSSEAGAREAVVMTAIDFYPFGMQMGDRKYQQDKSYRYGFQHMEKDDEVMGEDNSYDFKGRSIYSPRHARFVSVDPLWRQFSSVSSYTYSLNSPIRLTDKDGENYQEAQRQELERARQIGPQTREQLLARAREDARALVFVLAMSVGPAAQAGYLTTSAGSGAIEAVAGAIENALDGRDIEEGVFTDFMVGAALGVGGKAMGDLVMAGVKRYKANKLQKTQAVENSTKLSSLTTQELKARADEVEEIMLRAISQPSACFVGDTEILTAGNKFVHIKDISVEEEIYQLSEEEIQMLEEERAALEHVVEIHLADIKFLVEEDQLFIVDDEWIKAIDLVPGNHLLKMDGTTVEILMVKKLKKSALVKQTSDRMINRVGER